MAACGSLRPLFGKRSVAENPTLMESLSSWSQIKPMHPMGQPSFTEIFGELHFKEKPEAQTASPSPLPHSASLKVLSTPALDKNIVSLDHPRTLESREERGVVTESPVGKFQNNSFRKPVGIDGRSLSPDRRPASPVYQHGPCSKSPCPIFTPKHSESLHLCTEGLGFESSDDMDDSRSEPGLDWGGGGGEVEEEELIGGRQPGVSAACPNGCSEVRPRQPPVSVLACPKVYPEVRARAGLGKFPPPISVIGSSGKPWVWFKAYKGEGRFVLKEVRIPTYELLKASREDGRLKLHLVQPEDTAEEGIELEGVEAGEEHQEQVQGGGEGEESTTTSNG